MIERLAPAKINLALHVTGQRDDGYHALDTLAGFADIGDRLTLAPRNGAVALEIAGPFAVDLDSDTQGNIVLKAARVLAEAAGIKAGAAITLEKNLPVASGIGGGSADAAATLSGLRELWGLPADFALEPLALRLGADVPMCLRSRPLRATGIGEILTPLAGARALDVVLVNPGVAVATPQIFVRLASKANAPIGGLPEDPFDPVFLAGLRNDLEPPAVALFPEIGEVLNTLTALPGCLLARMSGSGATCFGVFGSREDAFGAHRHLVDTAPQWWSVPAILHGTR